MTTNKYKTDISDGTDFKYSVEIEEEDDDLWVIAYNNGGYDWTNINVKDLIKWTIMFKPLFIEKILEEYPIEKYKKKYGKISEKSSLE